MPEIIRDRNGWTCRVIEVLKNGVLVDWRHVGPDDMRYIENGDYDVIAQS